MACARSPTRKHRVGLLSLLACLAATPGHGIKIAEHAVVESDTSGYGKLYTEDEIKECKGFVGKGGVLVSEQEGWVHAINSCGGGGDVKNASPASDGTLLDPVTHNICVMKSSQDGGQTWSNFQAITPKGFKFEGSHWGGCKGLYDAVRNKIVVQYVYYPSGESSESAGAKYYQITSTDHGHTWTSPTEFTNALKPCFHDQEQVSGFAGTRIQTQTGRLLWAGFGFHGSTCLWWSDDGGETYYANHTNNEANEVSLINAGTNPNVLLMNGRSRGTTGENDRPNYFSFDNGETWSKPSPSGIKDSFNKHHHGCEASLANVQGKLFLMNPSGQGDAARTNMVVYCSLDKGKTWPKVNKIYQDTTSEGGYSYMAHVNYSKPLLLIWGGAGTGNIFTKHIDTDWCS